MKKKYVHLFFDLDHTLWDFKTNSRLTLAEIYSHFQLEGLTAAEVNEFIEVYEQYNHRMWADYAQGKMRKETLRTERFRQSLSHIGVKDRKLSDTISEYYVEHSPKKTALFPGTLETLSSLKENYRLHIITNGFEEVQSVKLDQSGLVPFFEEVITSEQAGVKKPHPSIFEFSLKLVDAKASESLMIGDNQLVDIKGAHKVGMDSIFFNPEKEEVTVQPTYEIHSLNQILDIL